MAWMQKIPSPSRLQCDSVYGLSTGVMMTEQRPAPGPWQARIDKEYASAGKAASSARLALTSHVDRLIPASRKHVHRIVTAAEGELVCHIVYGPPGCAHAWRSSRRRIANGELPLSDFGVVIASNPGLKPAPETLDLLRRKYGFDA